MNRYKIYFLLALFLLVLVNIKKATGEEPGEKVQYYYNRALRFFVRGECRKAIEECEKSLAINPNHRDSIKLIGRAKEEIKKWREYLEKEKESFPISSPASKAINLNTVTFKTLVSLPEIDEEKARSIIEYRRMHSGIKSIEELEKVLGPATAISLKESVPIYTVPQEVWESRLTKNISDLGIQQLIVKSFNLNGYAIYITFPDGGNMLIDTGSKGDAGKLVRLIKNEITQNLTKYEFVEMFGKKVRIDWVVITNPTPKHAGGLKKIIENFQVREVISPLSTVEMKENFYFGKLRELLRREKITYTNLSKGGEVDLEQIISPVKLKILNLGRGKKKDLSLRFSYLDFSLLILSGIQNEREVEILKKYENSLRSTVLFSDTFRGDFKEHIASYFINPLNKSVVVSDGCLFYIEKIE